MSDKNRYECQIIIIYYDKIERGCEFPLPIIVFIHIKYCFGHAICFIRRKVVVLKRSGVINGPRTVSFQIVWGKGSCMSFEILCDLKNCLLIRTGFRIADVKNL